MLRSLLLALAALLLGACAAEAENPPPPEPALELTGRVVDAANILSPEFESNVTQRLERLERETLVQLVVVTTPTLNGRDIGEYSTDLGNAWGIGDAERNDGLMIVVAPNERRMRIAVGDGLLTVVTNQEAADIINNFIVPDFRAGNFEAGISKGVEALALEVSNPQQREAA